MLTLSLLALTVAAANPAWHDDYDRAATQAIEQKKDLVIWFRDGDAYDDALDHDAVKDRLKNFVCLKVPASYEYRGQRLLDYDALSEMGGRPGLAIVCYSDPKLPSYNQVISAHPFVRSHYRWVPDYGPREVCVLLDLPPRLTLSQRSMIYALKVHPEQPRSVHAHGHAAFMRHAERHSARQAALQRQHHADIISVSNHLSNEVGEATRGGSEVVAESWGRVVGGENVLEAAFSCVDAWRHSPGHWGAVSRPHRYFGYDLCRGANGTWYATGIFAD